MRWLAGLLERTPEQRRAPARAARRPPGVLLLDFEGAEYRERYRGARQAPRRGMWLGLNTPAFRDWFPTIDEWRQSDEDERHPIPPTSIHDLPDTGLLTPDDLAEGVWLTANVWNGSAETEVTAVLPGGRTLRLERTQQGAGYGPAPPRPQSAIADHNMHLWRAQLPADLSLGVHRVDVEVSDRHGRKYLETLVIEVRAEPPARFFQREPWQSE